MRKPVSIIALSLSFCLAPALLAQRGRGIEFHGTPASVTSPGLNGQPRGIPASVADPTFTTRSNTFSTTRSMSGSSEHGRGHGRGHDGHRTPVYAFPYYGYYGGYYDSSVAYDQPASPQPQVIIVKEEPADRVDESSRYGEHSFDDRDNRRDEPQLQAKAAPAEPPAKVPDDSPMTTLVYRDGHKSEVRNYAIVGSNLIDLSKSPVLKKIPLESLDLVATRRENEENGLDFHAP